MQTPPALLCANPPPIDRTKLAAFMKLASPVSDEDYPLEKEIVELTKYNTKANAYCFKPPPALPRIPLSALAPTFVVRSGTPAPRSPFSEKFRSK